VRPCDANIEKTIQLTDEMIQLANSGDAAREDTGCGILYGVVRDAAYKIKKLAETEKYNHSKREQVP
jgi:hypothetical protein